MTLSLGFDTSGPWCGAVLLSDETCLAARHVEMAKGQAEHLMPLLEDVLADGGADWVDLDCLGVGIGPGNFTGVRISVSAARGLALALDVPAVGVSLLEAQAFGASGVVVSSLDARRDQLYVQVLGASEDAQPLLCDLETMPLIPPKPVLHCIGHRADEIAMRCGGVVTQPKFQTAEAIARLASQRFASVTDRPKPLYLRAADAAPPRAAPPVILS
jgi:tRNA threonylcarbamoyl adenosine modification protein YeaZ